MSMSMYTSNVVIVDYLELDNTTKDMVRGLYNFKNDTAQILRDQPSYDMLCDLVKVEDEWSLYPDYTLTKVLTELNEQGQVNIERFDDFYIDNINTFDDLLGDDYWYVTYRLFKMNRLLFKEYEGTLVIDICW